MTTPARVARPSGASLSDFADQIAAQAQAAQSLAQVTEPAVAQLQLIAFRLDAEEFGLPLATVREVIRVGDITRVPQAPEHIRGVTNLRGRILSVVEIRTRLGLNAAVPGPRSRIIVVEVQHRVVGLLVDSVSQVLKIGVDRVIPAPDEVRSEASDHISGVAHLDQRLVILLDLERMLFAPNRAVPSPS